MLLERALDERRRSAQTLSPTMRDVLAEAGWQPRDIDVVAVTLGPGSFTGLRIGVTTAKAFAYAARCAVVGVNTLEVLARAMNQPVEDLWAVVDAYRGQLFAGRFKCHQRQATWRGEAELLDEQEWLDRLTSDCTVTGPALEKLVARLPTTVAVAERALWTPQAAIVGLLGGERHTAGQHDDLWTLAPLYMRRSAAEEKADG